MGKIKEKEEAAQSRSTPLTRKILEETAKSYDTSRQKVSDATMKVAGIMQRFQDKGGNNKAFKLSCWVKSQEQAKGQDFVRSFLMYCHELGVFEQLDLLDEIPEIKKTAPVKKRKAPAAPSIPAAAMKAPEVSAAAALN